MVLSQQLYLIMNPFEVFFLLQDDLLYVVCVCMCLCMCVAEVIPGHNWFWVMGLPHCFPKKHEEYSSLSSEDCVISSFPEFLFSSFSCFSLFVLFLFPSLFLSLSPSLPLCLVREKWNRGVWDALGSDVCVCVCVVCGVCVDHQQLCVFVWALSNWRITHSLPPSLPSSLVLSNRQIHIQPYSLFLLFTDLYSHSQHMGSGIACIIDQ